ncbi:MAG: preprotein translocase subunit SecE [Vallitaleaceae bacterium]|jgi:preprotein translocase subunit SecE|nr:preprotein translocase subunit SecE [Vallitaleaceae bacterium]
MAEVKKKNFFKGVIGEFKKIIWPSFPTLMKQTLTVVLVSSVVGSIVALIDFGYSQGLVVLIK